MTLQVFLDAGYGRHVAKSYAMLKYTDTLMQKRVVDCFGTRYFIDVWVYDNRELKESGKMPEATPDYSYQPEVQFYDGNSYAVANITYMGNDKTPDAIEAWFAGVWGKLALGYYERHGE